MKRDRVDALWSYYVRLRAKGCCQYDGKFIGMTSGLHAMHCFSRGKQNLRYDIYNGAAGCYYHHMYLDHHPEEKKAFFIKLFGLKNYNRLNDLNNHPEKKIDKKQVELDLKEKIKDLENEQV